MAGFSRQRLKEKRKSERAREEGGKQKHLKGIMSKLWRATGVPFELLAKALDTHTRTHTHENNHLRGGEQ